MRAGSSERENFGRETVTGTEISQLPAGVSRIGLALSSALGDCRHIAHTGRRAEISLSLLHSM